MVKKTEDDSPQTVGSYCSHCESPTAFFLYKPDEFEAGGTEYTFSFGTCNKCNGPAVFVCESTDCSEGHAFARKYPLHRAALKECGSFS